MHRRMYRWTFTVVSIFAVGALLWGITQTLRRIDDATEGAMPPGISVPERRPFPSEDARPDERGSHDDEPVEATPTPFDNPASISGRVVNEAGEPVAGANVEADLSFMAEFDRVRVPSPIVASDSEGRFRIDGAPVGDYELQVCKQGFNSLTRQVRMAFQGYI